MNLSGAQVKEFLEVHEMKASLWKYHSHFSS